MKNTIGCAALSFLIVCLGVACTHTSPANTAAVSEYHSNSASQQQSLNQSVEQQSLSLNQVPVQQLPISAVTNDNSDKHQTAYEPIEEGSARLAAKGEENTIQIGLLLDTSNSMDGLIEQAKQQLWKLVNEVALAKDEDGNIPPLEIALYEYGNDNLFSKDGYVRQVSALTKDLDLISEQLFSLTTNGGSEYCGTVIQRSAKQLAWLTNTDNFKVLFIAGNETFTQGSIDYTKSVADANRRGILINTIFCGTEQYGIEGKWKAAADLSGGDFLTINQDEVLTYIKTPYDLEIESLNDSLNNTYISYGSRGKALKSRQMMQDRNASSYGVANSVQRAISKSSTMYKNTEWDLVDAAAEDTNILNKVEFEELPDVLKGKTQAQQQEYIDKKAKDRKLYQDKIQALNAKRRQYIATEHQKQAEDKGNTLDNAIIETIRKQAKRFGFTFQ